MDKANDRRRFLGLLGAGGMFAALLNGGSARGAARARQFRGTSAKGDIEEALQKAIAAAAGTVKHPDAMVEWTLKSVAGRSGGIAGFNQITVTIEAKVP